jgi:glycosyltransferase involved in cell wall biosynthesis
LGKFLAGKGQEDAVKAMAQLRRMSVPAELLLLGAANDQQYYQRIVEIIERYDLTDCVHILGHSPNPAPLVNSADVLLMCSRREAFGRVSVEGMKLGKPVIGTCTGGTPELVEEGRTGYLYPPGDAEQLAARISHLYANPSLREEMGARARCWASKRFSQQQYGKEVEDVLKRILGTPQPGQSLLSKQAALQEAGRAA